MQWFTFDYSRALVKMRMADVADVSRTAFHQPN
jgi:hypothetical protein